MLIKSADDKSKRLALLEDLQKSARLDAQQKEWLSKELWNTRRGIEGERSAAHYLNNYLASSKNHMLLHDLRIVVEDEVAQIDHLIIGRAFFILVETKTFGGDITLNEHGEFSVQYPGQRIFGIPSPLQQSRRHENVLHKLLQRLEIKPRTGGRQRMEHVVLVDPKRSIQRPDPKKLDSSYLVKADQYPDWHKKWADSDLGFFETMTALADLRGQDTVKNWAEMIARQHRPANLLDLPDFMRPKEVPTTAAPSPKPQSKPNVAKSPTPMSNSEPSELKRKLICATCGDKITFNEGKYCWNQPQRFGDLQYCREHQAVFK
jgi:hypothetical protein